MVLCIKHMIEVFDRIVSIINNDSSSNIKIQIRNNRIKFRHSLVKEWRDWYINLRNYGLLEDLNIFLFGYDISGYPQPGGSILFYIKLAKQDFKSYKMLSTISQPESLEEWNIKLDLLGL